MFRKLTMFNKLKEKTLLLFISMMPLSVMAHPGHDHHSPWANLIHLLWLSPIIIAAYFLFKNYKKKNSHTKK